MSARGWNGSGDKTQRGTVTVSLSASSTGSATVFFNPPFSSTPKVYPGVGGTFYTVGWSAKSSGQATINVRRYNDSVVTATVDVDWEASVA